MQVRSPKRLVVDADVVCAMGGPEALDATSAACRDALAAVYSICHHVVRTDTIREEWRRWRSSYAYTWSNRMLGAKKLPDIEVEEQGDLRAKVLATAASQSEADAISKDLQLIEAALATDGIVVSRDREARRLFARAARTVGEIKHSQPRAYRQWTKSPVSVRPPEGETVQEAQDRLRAAAKAILKRQKNGAALLVLRPVALGLLKCWTEHVELAKLWQHVDMTFRWGCLEVDVESL